MAHYSHQEPEGFRIWIILFHLLLSYHHTDGEGNKNDLNEKTGYLENEQVLIVLADKADETTPSDYM